MRFFEFARDLRPLYVNRPVLNGEDIQLWAKSQGFTSTLPPEDFHITISYSNVPVDHALADPDDESIDIEKDEDENRTVEQFKGGAVVLTVPADELTDRWQYYNDKVGVVPTFPDYRAHVTITYLPPEGLDLTKVRPYRGVVELGPELMSEPSQTWKEDTKEVELADLSD